MWLEDRMKQAVEVQLDTVFGQPVVLLDMDTYDTPAGRVDTVALTATKQLVVVEIEQQLNLGNIEHALIDQAWAYAQCWYEYAQQRNIEGMHRYYRQYRFPNERDVPDLRQQLGFDPGDQVLWDKQQECIVVAAGWRVAGAVYDKARSLMREISEADKNGMPCEVWIYDVKGEEAADGRVRIVDCNRTKVFERANRKSVPQDGPGLRIPNQHLPARLSEEFRQVALLLPNHTSWQLKRNLEFFSKVKWKTSVLKLCPWGTACGICFEFSRMDAKNQIKGAHCQLYVCQQKDLGARLRQMLQRDRAAIARELGCRESDFTDQTYSYPIKQHRVDDSSPEVMARAFGRFSSVIYARVDATIRAALADGIFAEHS